MSNYFAVAKQLQGRAIPSTAEAIISECASTCLIIAINKKALKNIDSVSELPIPDCEPLSGAHTALIGLVPLPSCDS